MENQKIRCDVCACKYNERGENCSLSSIKVTCGCDEDCTCCGDFCEK